jgi:hypothetical protein
MRIRLMAVMALLLLPSSALAQAAPYATRGPLAGTSPSPTATLSPLRGWVEVATGTGPSAESHAARPGETLSRGARLRVGENGAAEITLSNGAVLEVGERSNLTMFTATATSPEQVPSTTSTLTRGVVRVRMAPGTAARTAALIPIGTDSVTVFVGRSDGVISVDDGGAVTRVSVLRGRARVVTAERDFALTAGSGVIAEPSRAPAQGAVVTRDDASRGVTSRALPSSRRRATRRASGGYDVRVVAVDRDRVESAPEAAPRAQTDATDPRSEQLASAGPVGR